MVFETAVTEKGTTQVTSFEYLVGVRCEDLETALFKHTEKGYAVFNHVHIFLWANLDLSGVASALTGD